MPNFFGTQLRIERKKRKLTAEAVAAACGVSRSYIILIEGGERLPGKKTLPKIADALNLDLVEVLNWYLDDVAAKMKRNLNL